MTCIVGVVDKAKVYIGGDSASSDDYIVRRSAVPKVFRCGSFVIGYTLSWRMGQILEHHLEIIPSRLPKVGDSLQQFMVQEFIGSVRQIFVDQGYAWKENNRETGGEFLVGYNGHLFHVGTDYQVNETLDGIDACGSGVEIALGVLWANRLLSSPDMRIEMALEAAAYYKGNVRPPWIIKAC